MKRRPFVALIAVALVNMFVQTLPVLASTDALYKQIFSLYFGDSQGVDVSVKWQDQIIPPGHLIAVPVAITTYYGPTDNWFMEVGPFKDCTPGKDCQLHVYTAWQNGSDATYNVF